MSLDTFLLLADLLGTFVFALSGATVAVRARFDIFGIIVLSFVAATFGGMFRDLLLGDHPPGTLLEFGPDELPATGLGVSSHGFGVSEAVRLAATLGALPAELVVLALEVGGPEQALNVADQLIAKERAAEKAAPQAAKN